MSNTEAMQRALTEVVSRGDFTVPPYPAVALRLQRLLARDGYGVSEVADVIATDAALAATVLAAANSPLLGSDGSQITSLSRAVNRLGARTVRSITLASGLSHVTASGGVLRDVKFRVWRRGITCALICQRLAPGRELDAEEAFLAGLLYGFGRAIAITSLEELLKTHQPPRPLSVAEWLNIAEQQRAALGRAVAQNWHLPPPIAETVAADARSLASSALGGLIAEADRMAADLEAGRVPRAAAPAEQRLMDQLIAGLPSALEAFAPPPPPTLPPTVRPSPVLAKPEHVLEGELRKKTVSVVDKRAKGAATLACLALSPTGLVLSSSRPFQESSVVRLTVEAGGQHLEPWLNVVLCVPEGTQHRIELELFSPTRELRERWRALYDA